MCKNIRIKQSNMLNPLVESNWKDTLKKQKLQLSVLKGRRFLRI